jgi:hypothetical protein
MTLICKNGYKILLTDIYMTIKIYKVQCSVDD